MLQIVLLFASVFVAAAVGAPGETPQKSAKQPSLAETIAWLESEGAELLSADSRLLIERSDSRLLVTTKNVRVKSCVLSFVQDVRIETTTGTPKHEINSIQMPLRQVRLGGLELNANAAWQPAVYSIDIPTLKGATTITKNGETWKTSNVNLYVKDARSAQRMESALGRAAVLCGAPSPPF